MELLSWPRLMAEILVAMQIGARSAPSGESTGKLKLDHVVEVLPVRNMNEQHGFVPLPWVTGPRLSPQESL